MPCDFSAIEVWTQTPVANRTVEVNTKTGFSLTAGSYSVRASSTQTGSLSLTGAANTQAVISSVTTTRTVLTGTGRVTTAAVTALDRGLITVALSSATTVDGDKGTATDNAVARFFVLELF